MEVLSIKVLITLPWTFTVKENHVGSAVSKIISFMVTHRQTRILLLLCKELNLNGVSHKPPPTITINRQTNIHPATYYSPTEKLCFLNKQNEYKSSRFSSIIFHVSVEFYFHFKLFRFIFIFSSFLTSRNRLRTFYIVHLNLTFCSITQGY